MKYKFNYKDGRNYTNSIKDGMRIEANRGSNGDIVLKIFTNKSENVEIILNSNEATVVAHSLLSAVNSNFKIFAEQ